MANNMFCWKIFIHVVLHTTIVRGISNYFKKQETSYNLDLLSSYRGHRSSLECATKFELERTKHPKCVAFSFYPVSRTCAFYHTEGNQANSRKDLFVYTPEQHCDTSDGFQEIWMENQMFCYAIWRDQKKSYSDASKKCSSLGGYLLNFDSSSEFKAVKSLYHQDKAWVGANDKDIEGRWITDQDGTPISDSWIWGPGQPNNGVYDQHCSRMYLYIYKAWVGANDKDTEGRWITDQDGTPISDSWIWGPGQPNNGGNNQHCAHTKTKNGYFGVYDQHCSRMYLYICERTT